MRTLLFDLDGTLVNSVPDLTTALNTVVARDGLAPFAEAEVARMVGDGVRVLLERGFSARGATPDAEAQQRFMAVYGAHVADDSRPYPHVAETLRSLAEAGWRMAVCTNKPEALARKLLETLGLLGFFAAVAGGDSYPTRKPDPAHVTATLAAAGDSGAGAIMIGDHHNDISAATGAGLPCIYAAWGYGGPDMGAGAAAVANDFSEIPALVAGM